MTTMQNYDILRIGDQTPDGKVQIVDKDRLCYVVRQVSKESYGIRTISKKLLAEYIDYFRQHPTASSDDARRALSGHTDVDRFEYGYTATLMKMAKMVLEPSANLIHDTTSVLPFAQRSTLPLIDSLQQITYGAPGTGKSHGINTLLKTTNHVRTTFHPDSDYASFVGAYKPTMVKQEKRICYDVLDNDNKHEEEEIIAYKFVPQAFIKAYVSAWKNYPKETVLVIEEINRGNCAQIFGDLFQLLDRKDNGFSSYPIDADADIAQYLCSELKDILPNEGDVSEINNVFSENYPDGIVEQIKNGTKLLLPNNLYIWATMNTSDQSLFPIDSAFKRRWDWKFVKISDAHKNWTIHFGDEACDWWEFIKQMNRIIAKETSSDDKKLGYFFCKPSNEDEDFINEERFVGKVLFYLWNDVFKDGETKYFKVTDNPDDEPTFEAFYNDDCTPCVAAVRKFIVGIVGEENVHKIGEQIIPQQVFDDFENKIDYTKYSFDGKDRLSKKVLGESIVLKYINEHINDTFDALQKVLSFGDKVPTKYQYKGIIVQSEYITGSYVPCFGEEHTSSDGVKYKILTWWNKYNVDFIINFAKQQGWTVTEVND